MNPTARRIRQIEQRLAQTQRRPLVLPDQPLHFIDFVTNPRFLDKPLFPRQGTLLKVMDLDVENLTPYDHEVIAEWTAGFERSGDADHPTWTGRHGTPGDLMARIGWNRAQRRRFFHHIELLLGRRGSKNYLASLFIAWVVWNLISGEDPHERFGIDPTKRLTGLIFAGKKRQAIDNQLRDLSTLLRSAPAFRPFHPQATIDSVVLFTPRQLAQGVDTKDRNEALIEIRAAESTIQGGRGPASFLLGFDEFAFVQGAGSTANSIDLYESAYPSTTQFAGNAPVVETTSPWDRQGQAWETYKQATAIDPATGEPSAPDHLLVQLPSWHLYQDHERADTLPMWPGGPNFAGGLKPIIEFDGVIEAKRDANPESFDVEYNSQWRQSQFTYLSPLFVNRVFAPYKGEPLQMQTHGPLSNIYAAHGDPSLSQANFGFTIAHLERDDNNIPHVVFDLIHHWAPRDFPNGVVDYIQIEAEILAHLKAFTPTTVTFDQWNSAGVIQRLQADVNRALLPRRVNVSERNASKEGNWEMYETLKTAIGHDIIHAPEYALARAELEGLEVRNGVVCASAMGDTRTKDVTDAMANTVWALIGHNASEIFEQLARLRLTASQPAAPEFDPKAEVLARLSGFSGRRYEVGARRGPTVGRGRPNWGGRTSTNGNVRL